MKTKKTNRVKVPRAVRHPFKLTDFSYYYILDVAKKEICAMTNAVDRICQRDKERYSNEQ
jgi:hypothetical protein